MTRRVQPVAAPPARGGRSEVALWRLSFGAPARLLTRLDTLLASAVLRLKRIDPLPVSTMWQWCVRRSSSAVVILASPNTLDHSTKSRLVVINTLVCSDNRLSRWNSSAPPAWLKGS